MSDTLLVRIAALLRKAESTSNEHEAEAFMAKAQELATREQIDLAVARAHTVSAERRSTPEQRHIRLGEAGQRGLSTYVMLFSGIARANDVEINVAHNSTFVIAFGMPEDIDLVAALYTSLVQQMVAASNRFMIARRADPKASNEVYWSDRHYEFRKVGGLTARLSFQESFATTVGQRLREARQAAVDTATESQAPGVSTELVLSSKRAEVAAYHKQTSRARGTYRGGRSQRWSASGHEAGQAAGRRARLGSETAIGGQRTAIGG